MVKDIDIKSRIRSLESEIKKHNKLYYQDNDPIISDAEYDKLFTTLKSLEQKFPQYKNIDSPTERVGAAASKKFLHHKHIIPMLSLNNVFSEKDARDFIFKTQRFLLQGKEFINICCELKIDGLSFSAIYKKGRLVSGATRGDGYVGEDITNNLKMVKDFPLIIGLEEDFLEIRGEIYMSKYDFRRLNSQNLDKEKFSSPRNAAAGSLRHIDALVTKERNLRYFAYGIGHCSFEFSTTQKDLLARLKELGFIVNHISMLATSFEDMFLFYSNTLSRRESLEYDIDGVVYKVNDLNLQKRLGSTSRSPRFSVAHKFPEKLLETQLLGIEINVGRTGAVTPLAILEPVRAKGALIRKATLHNFYEIIRKDIRIGDFLEIKRAGDVIPKILGVNLSKRNKANPKFNIPKSCPSCGSSLIIESDSKIIRCVNFLKCPSQIMESLKHFVSKKALNISGMGKKQIMFFLKHNIVHNICDIFLLKKYLTDRNISLKTYKFWGEKSVNNLLQSIEYAKNVSLEKFIYALGIPNIGEYNALSLAQEYKTINNFVSSLRDKKDIISIEGFGEKITEELRNFFSIKENLDSVEELMSILNIADHIPNTYSSISILSGKKLVFTGELASMSRQEAKALINKIGAKVQSNISSKTDFVVLGQNPGSKLKIAQELGIKILTEKKFLEFIK